MNSESGGISNQVRVEIAGLGKDAATKILGSSFAVWGQEYGPLPGVVVVNKTEEQRGMTTLHQVIEFTITYGRDLSANLVAAWLYDIIKEHVAHLRINGKKTMTDRGAIEAEFAKLSKKSKSKGSDSEIDAPQT